jgi:hypothetical protein
VRFAARQRGVPEVLSVLAVVEAVAVAVVVGLAVVVALDTVGAAAGVVVLAGAAVVVVVELVELPELPHEASASASGTIRARRVTRARRFMRLCSGMVSSAPPLALHRQARATIRDATMDPSEELRQPRSPTRRGRLAMIERWLPFWEPQLVVACAIALQLSLSSQVTVGPTWLLPSLEGALLVGLVIVSPHPNVRHSRLRRHLALGMIAFVSAANIASLFLLCQQLLHGGKENGHALILSGIALWCTNVLLFGLWYWEVDRGGPAARAVHEPDVPDFLFPQMSEPRWAPPNWMPQLVDYLYVSLTNATASSPTDTMPLTPTAKWLMSAQSLASLVTVGLVVARAVNILGS